jgi:hypothetical protein
MASTTRIYTQDDRSRRVLQLDDDSTVNGPYGACVGRLIGVLASHGMRPGAIVPPWVYRAVAYESGDPFRQPVWMCDHDHSRAQEAQLCGADWARSQSLQNTQA